MWVVYATCVSKNSIVSQDVIFYLLWCKVIRWSSHLPKNHIFSFYSFLVKFREWHRGSARVKLTKCDKAEWSEKCHYASDFLNYPMFNFFFFVILFYIEGKWLHMKHLATILPFKSKLSGKFQRFNAIDRTESILDIEVMGEFFVSAFSVKRKFCLLAPP